MPTATGASSNLSANMAAIKSNQKNNNINQMTKGENKPLLKNNAAVQKEPLSLSRVHGDSFERSSSHDNALDSATVSSSNHFKNINKLINGRFGSREKGQLVEILKSLSDKELNMTLSFMDLSALLSRMDNQTPFVSDPNYLEMLKFFSQSRVMSLKTEVATDFISALLKRHTGKIEELCILDMLQRLPSADLNKVLNRVDINRLVDNFHDHFAGAKLKSRLIEFLCKTRARDLNGENKAAVISLLLDNFTSRLDEAYILNILQQTSDEQINDLLERVNLVKLFNDVDDRVLGPDNREELLRCLGKKTAAINILRRADIIQALYESGINLDAEKCIDKLFAQAQGEDLVRLKLYMDCHGDDSLNLHELIFKQIKNRSIQSRMLNHIQQCAKGVSDSNAQVYMNQSDHIVRNNGGNDKYPDHISYPGAKQFFASLTRLNQPVMRYSCRPTYQAKEHDKLFPEFAMMFVLRARENNKKGNLSLQQALSARKNNSNTLVLMFDDRGIVSADERRELASQGVHVFDTYLAAAALAHEKGFLNEKSFNIVAKSTASDFSSARFNLQQYKEARALYQADAKIINSTLTDEQKIVIE